MKKNIYFFVWTLLFFSNALSGQAQKEKINWLTVQEAVKQYDANPKPILIDIFTSWCGWCKVMDKETYANEKVAKYINENYYAVKFDAESSDSIAYGGKIYQYNPEYKTNELAIYFLYGRLEYPSTVFLPAINAQPAPLSGFLKPDQIEAPLKYFGDGAYKTQTFVEFTKIVKQEW